MAGRARRTLKPRTECALQGFFSWPGRIGPRERCIFHESGSKLLRKSNTTKRWALASYEKPCRCQLPFEQLDVCDFVCPVLPRPRVPSPGSGYCWLGAISGLRTWSRSTQHHRCPSDQWPQCTWWERPPRGPKNRLSSSQDPPVTQNLLQFWCQTLSPTAGLPEPWLCYFSGDNYYFKDSSHRGALVAPLV